MEDNKKVVESKPLSDEDRAKAFTKDYEAKDFQREYQELCDKMKFRIVCTPSFVATNHNSFELVIQYAIGALPKE